jgi:putative SOS response-associated peptidase YedK
MKMLIALIVAAAAFIAFCFGLFQAMKYAEHEAHEEEREWTSFTQQHHCAVVSNKWYEQTIWQCDGFQVKHP